MVVAPPHLMLDCAEHGVHPPFDRRSGCGAGRRRLKRVIKWLVVVVIAAALRARTRSGGTALRAEAGDVGWPQADGARPSAAIT